MTSIEYAAEAAKAVGTPDAEHSDRMNLVDKTVRFGTMTPPDVADSISTTQLYEVTNRLEDLNRVRAIFREWTDNLDDTERRIREQLRNASEHGVPDSVPARN